MMNYRRPQSTELVLTRTIPAAPAAVYDVWLEVGSPGSPWSGCKRVILDARVDGLFYHLVEHEGTEWAHYGRFTALERPRRIQHTWMSEGTRGLESVVTVTFEPDGAGTRVTLRHAGVPDDDFGRTHRDGWGHILGQMAERFAGRAR